MDSFIIATPTYGGQNPKFWSRLLTIAQKADAFGLEFKGILTDSTAETAHNQNVIVEKFLELNVDYLFWVEQDTVPPAAGLGRLYDVSKPIVSGLYVGKKHPFRPIAYRKRKDGLYQSIENFTPGEIAEVDAAGMGCVLIHRSVYENIQKNYEVLQRASGGTFLVHKDRIKGKIPSRHGKSDGEVRNGVLQERVFKPAKSDLPYPFYISEFGRTSDFHFYERAKELGYRVFVDTGVVCDHIGNQVFNLEDFKKQLFYEQFGKNTPPELLHVSA